MRGTACFGEILRDGFLESEGWPRLVARLDMPDDAEALYREDLTAFWDLFLERGLQRRSWFGAKVFYYHRAADPVWDRFEAADHRIFHLWRDATFDQYVSRELAIASGEWKSSGEPAADVRVRFDPADYRVYRERLRGMITAARARYGGSDRYVELEYRQLSDHELVRDRLERLFGDRPELEERRVRQRPRPKIEYLTNPVEAEPFAADSISGGFAEA